VFEDQEVPIGGAVTNGAIPELAKRQVPWRMLDFDRIHPSCYDPVERSVLRARRTGALPTGARHTMAGRCLFCGGASTSRRNS
jgi:hypothetical protein